MSRARSLSETAPYGLVTEVGCDDGVNNIGVGSTKIL